MLFSPYLEAYPEIHLETFAVKKKDSFKEK